MAYRAIQRVLGASSLERKCRLLFGASLLLLIFGSFGWYGIATTQMVHDKNRRTGQHLVDTVLIKYHFEKWETITENIPLVQRHILDLENLKYDWSFLALELSSDETAAKLPEDLDERQGPQGRINEAQILNELRDDYVQQLREERQRAETEARHEVPPVTADEVESDYDPTKDLVKKIVPEFRDVRVIGGGKAEYRYYQPVYWKERCVVCHVTCQPTEFKRFAHYADESTVNAGGDQLPIFDEHLPFRVVKVVISDDPTQRAINRNYSILLATAIITVFLAMIALYVVVRYVIVKPLKHLSDVSDGVAKGNYELRAELETNDELEDVARSFNRMVRHLVEAQQQLRGANTELDAKVDELAQVNMQLYEMNRLKSDFLANMSHELRTPLNSIIGFADVLQGIDSLNEKQQRYALNIGKSGRALLEMINDILDLAKMESGKMGVRPSEFSIENLVKTQCDIVRSMSEEKNIDLEVDCPPGLPDMFQDRSKVQQILTNLLSNAIKFTPEGGRICVRVAHEPAWMRDASGGRLVLTVEDTGVGIAEEDRDVVFEKFRQAKAAVGGDNLAREYSGTGLGLSIVKELCKLLGGEITFESQLGRGSSFASRFLGPCQPPR